MIRSNQSSPLSRSLAVFLLAGSFVVPAARVFAQEHPPAEPAAHADEHAHPPAQKPEEEAAPVERSSVTQHSMMLGGRQIRYTATAGTLLIRNEEDKPYGSIFYVAYTADGAESKTRPVTFLYNGGPGSASLWLHMGSVGPMRVITNSPAATGSGPYQVVPNEYSLLDQSDLVFIDAPLTGYSRAVGKATVKDFAGVDPDLRAFAKVIERYLSVNQRWNSPKFLFGESYGTTRSAGLSAVLQEDGVALNGITLLSSVLNYNASIGAGLEVSYVNYLPSYAAIAYYHKKLPQMPGGSPAAMAAFVEEARVFARGEYAEALAEGEALPPARVDEIAAKLNHFTGLPVSYIKEAKLRINPTRFRKELLRGDGDILGRYDARFEGTEVDDAGENPSYDPSDTGISGVYVAAVHDYLQRELKYESTDEYKLSANTIGEWDWHHRAVGAGGRGAQQLPYVAGDLGDTIRKNPKLQVLSANGWFDLATPFFATEYELNHMMLAPELAKNVHFTYYPAGHMVYLNVDALRQLRDDLRPFYQQAEK
ncbi:S10 family peptidase [Acidipila sp. EB88]|uniref:S10 family peptidase n=1 Tax=Acidipila sp. EB88 TaxID=2305226 RepID=UPI001F3EF72C|nr:peptidase S10 [Acidipila sp. EB88]